MTLQSQPIRAPFADFPQQRRHWLAIAHRPHLRDMRLRIEVDLNRTTC